MNSYWEKKTYLTQHQDVVIGCGIVGLFTALYLKRSNPLRRVVVVDGHPFSSGASTKNAGFACFGSPSELLDDLTNSSPEDVASLVEMRWKGLENLRAELGDKEIEFSQVGGFEMFGKQDVGLFEECSDAVAMLNQLVGNKVGKACYQLSNKHLEFKSQTRFIGSIENKLEGALNTGKMMWGLRRKCQELGIEMLTGIAVDKIELSGVSPSFFWMKEWVECERLFVCVNGFASRLIENLDVVPARNQVVVTSVFENTLPVGTFHADRGYIYFRNVENRLLIGGFRNLDMLTKTTDKFGLSTSIQEAIQSYISEYITNEAYTIEHQWSGIMGVGKVKQPIITSVAPGVFVGVRMGGMGVAIGGLVGKKLAELANSQ